MRKVSREPLELEPPDNVEMVWIDLSNGLRASEACTTAIQYPFIAGSAPAEFSACSQSPLDDAVEKAGSWLRGLF
jgi:penicillin-binding protein 1B